MRASLWLAVLVLACGARRAAPPAETHAPAPAPAPESSSARCGPSSCAYASEACCEAEDDMRQMTGCVKKALAPADKGHRCYGERSKDWMGIECRTSAECPSSQSCCAVSDETLGFTHCAAQCEESVACVPGAAHGCREGFRCQPVPSSRSGGVCVVDPPRTACGDQVCTGATPACCYDAKTKQARCVAVKPESHTVDDPVCPLNDDTAFLQCTTPAECGGEHCCTAGPVDRTSCSGMCMTGIWTCSTIQDCPEFVGPPTGCVQHPKVPFLKVCDYQSAR